MDALDAVLSMCVCVKRVHVVLSVLRMGLFACVHTWMLFKYGCRCHFAVFTIAFSSLTSGSFSK